MAVVNLYCTNNFEIPMMDLTFADAALVRAEKLLVCMRVFSVSEKNIIISPNSEWTEIGLC